MEQLGNTPQLTLDKLAESLNQGNPEVPELVLAISSQIRKHGGELEERRIPRTITESRFTPAQEAYDTGLVSCGTMASISAEMLRHLGYQVKLVHGEVPQSVDHAWITVQDKDADSWTQYDLTRKDGKITPEHKVKLMCDKWEDIKEQIESDRLTMHERREARSLLKSQNE